MNWKLDDDEDRNRYLISEGRIAGGNAYSFCVSSQLGLDHLQTRNTIFELTLLYKLQFFQDFFKHYIEIGKQITGGKIKREILYGCVNLKIVF